MALHETGANEFLRQGVPRIFEQIPLVGNVKAVHFLRGAMFL